ncbi:luciferin 4-monooxygenase-like [Onthophagus taurus]|uniref:luciferin 4-monooxygenase-like n=1 Tax=Onthophagus taurus TaxID=166361 RepID=UPI0039BE55C2
MENFGSKTKNNYVYGPEFNKHIGKDGFGCFIFDKFTENGDRIFQIDGLTGKSETYENVLKRSIRVALEMKTQGVTEDDVIVLCSGNTLDCCIPIFAAHLLNASVAALDPSQSVRDVVYLMNLIEPKMIFVQDSALDLITTAEKEFLFTPKIIVMGEHIGEDSFDNFTKPNPNENNFRPKPIEDRNKAALIMFSSGTTGMPKGISMSAESILTSVLAAEEYCLSDTIGFHATSFYWISAMLVTISIILNKGHKVILSRYSIDSFFKAVEQYKINFALLSPTLVYEFNQENVTKYNLNSLKFIAAAGGRLTTGHMERCRQLLPRAAILSAYGLTEACGYVLVFPKTAYSEAKKYPASTGLPIPGFIVKVVDPETEEVLGPNQQGEIRIYSSYHFKEYFKKNSSDAFDNEDFVKTGDVGYYDKNNYFYICDRIKDMFKYKSWHIVPASVEGVILQHPAVKEAVVVGIPDPIDGDLPMAVVTLKKGFENTDEDELIHFVNERVLDREKLRGGLRIVEEFPKTPTGKIPRNIVRKAAIEGHF